MARYRSRIARGRRREGGRAFLGLLPRNGDRDGTRGHGLPPSWPAMPRPIRLDIWTGRTLHDAGRELASTLRPDLADAPERPIRRLIDNQAAIRRNYLETVAADESDEAITPAAEWLIDNHHMVEENLRQLRQAFGPDFLRRLPEVELSGGGTAPRSLVIAWFFVALTNSEVTGDGLTEFLRGYQSVAVLDIAELWAVPTFLRYVLVENLRRLSDRVAQARDRRVLANAIADELAEIEGSRAAAAVIDRHGDLVIDDTVAAQLFYRLRDGGAEAQAALKALERRLGSAGAGDRAVQAEYARQSRGNVTVGNIIRSLRRMGEIDWLEWFEGVSHVDALLSRATEFDRLDQATRADYRSAIERIARRSDLTEMQVAQRAIDQGRADASARDEPAGSRAEVGHLLVGARRRDFRRACGYRPRPVERLAQPAQGAGWWMLALPLLAITAMLISLLGHALPSFGLAGWQVALLLTLAVLPASDTAMQAISFIAARVIPPQRLPAYDFRAGVPPESRTLVVIPGMITSVDAIDELAGMLESHYLANPLGDVSFALLSDWKDAPTESLPDDERLLAHARARIDALADRYDHGGIRRFFLLHRSRQWNPSEGVWMGWERKRGKLAELNQLLRGHEGTSFLPTGPTPPEGIRYVVTLDSDTRLPRDTVSALAGKMAHPVNRPVHREDGVVIRGYGIMQPRVTPSLTTGAEASVFQRIFSANRGLDPYVFTVSDLYQDLAGEGSFTGKGIYDVDAFERAIGDRIRENAVLSHDLLEGSLARSALVTDVEVVEDFPIRYATEASRQHRWTRGDWQLLPLILDPRNGLSGLSRFKMVDNLRRSLVTPFWVAGSIAGWLMLPGAYPILWQAALILLVALVPVLQIDMRIFRPGYGVSWDYHLRHMGRDLMTYITQLGLRLGTAAHRAAASVDAIGRALWRMFVSRRNLLEWRTARELERAAGDGVRGEYRRMAASPVIGALGILATAVLNPVALPVALVIGGIWIASPWIMDRASRPLETEDRLIVPPGDEAELRRIARRTWRYFEAFVGPETNHLPPDNWQADPEPKLAERTSPTNIGLYLMSVMSARDFGWIGLDSAMDRIDATISSMERMARFRGHFFNWYDTRNLAVLPAPYVSAVDSGNLAGLLIALSAGLRVWADDAPSVRRRRTGGLKDALANLALELEALDKGRRSLRDLQTALDGAVAGMQAALEQTNGSPVSDPIAAAQLTTRAAEITRLSTELDAATQGGAAEVLAWAHLLERDARDVMTPAPEGREAIEVFMLRTRLLAERARALAFGMDFGLFVQKDKMLLSIGYRPLDDQLDESSYDLLASEARLTSFLSIAKGDISKEHWARLGRPFATVGHQGVLLSWSGCMFEYLMPPLLLKERQGGILNHSNMMAVQVQMDWGRSHGVPWGISESAFNARDRQMNYQYYAFGVPVLALKRAYGEYVVAPYATILAAQIRPHDAARNLARLREMGAEGPYGFYDAVDFAPARLREGRKHEIVRNVMAHHHGMSIMAIANTVMDGIHRERFHADPVVRASELLLQEKSPRDITPVTRTPSTSAAGRRGTAGNGDTLTAVDEPARADREVALLSNGPFSTILSSTGAGRSVLGGVALNRWSPDPTMDDGGIFVFLRDMQSGEWWSATHSPCAGTDERSSVVFADHKAEFLKTANAIESRLEVIAAAGGHADGRRLTLRNRSGSDKTIEITSYGEIVLDNPASDRAHPAFSKMFVQTEIRDGGTLIAADRRPRDPRGRSVHMAHLVAGPEGAITPGAEAETDRRAFIGRGRSIRDPAALDRGATLTGAHGHTLDPVFAIRRRVRVPAGKSVSLVFWTLIADTAEERDRMAAHFARPAVFEHELRLAWTYSQVQLRHLHVTLDEAKLFRSYAALLIWPDLRLAATPKRRTELGPQSDLWPLGISGDDPILLLRTDDEADLPIIREALRMHEFLRHRGVAHDVVILNERASSYVQDLQHAIQMLVDTAWQAAGPDAPRHVHAVRRDQISKASFDTLVSAARIMLHTRNGRLAEQIDRLREAVPAALPRNRAPVLIDRRDPKPAEPSRSPLMFWNGFGGFSPDGREYVLRPGHDRPTPHPWINVIAREDFGFHVSAEGAPYTWAVNSRDYQITPWSNDSVTNRPGEALLIHDPSTGRTATPFLGLSDDPAAVHEIAHGLGYSRFTADYGWVTVEAVMTLAEAAPARLTRLTVTNRSGRVLNLQVMAFAELVLGTDRTRTAPMVQTFFDPLLNATLARNAFSTEHANRITALACDRPADAHCGDRAGFVGRFGDLRHPAALQSWPQEDAAGDPCLALRIPLALQPGEAVATTLVLANAPQDDIGDVLRAALAPDGTDRALASARAGWDEVLNRLQVQTPDPALNLMVNTWLPYQALACRIRARTAFYQASGAFGFRDQLQDTSALILQDPQLCRRQILNAASRQFPEGDVQHWWLPRTGAGVRTMISDDVVWLGHITALYVTATGDAAILDETVPFISGPALEPGEHDRFYQPQPAGEEAPLYEHCARALDLAMARTGEHGLPLILGGDWNDGMNRVGEEGRGESVWLGWFLCDTIAAFAPLARARGDEARAEAWEAHARRVAQALDDAGWDGAWYRRGFFDDGTPLGSAGSPECRIDSIAQSWAMISGAGRADRAQDGVNAALAQLFDRNGQLLQLFTPPFQNTEAEPGYIKSYPPGVRENGGQYTHAAAWMVYALARSGDGDRAHHLLSALNPINHALDARSAEIYRVEPYVVAADVYAARDKMGRGGWTWYTGSAGWLYRAAVEGLLGIRRRPEGIEIDPSLPDGWPGFSATISIEGMSHEMAVTRQDGGLRVTLDGKPVTNRLLSLPGLAGKGVSDRGEGG
ncbi:GH36-type glycosyl hydrolase domain-containing protein [Paracoccus sp. MC1862]|uniref:GH36-type glycosyl hydrolase domain-containing protein n=2 Tax=Paracoccus sp. MC1862 TaxID=2760307 RepID=UPI00180165C2|nr:glucoamylase family protein [Paracoccus sp. MC1862]MBB1498512.1 protein ndvB [Paracoccus sp. MC1862]QQO43860.1 carbohydrate-binding protein [Paracoccus sp. MC1862]